MICFLGPSPVGSGTNGYLQRIRQIDQFFSLVQRTYLDFASAPRAWLKTKISSDLPKSFVLDPTDKKQQVLIASLLDQAQFIYAHSLFKILPLIELLESRNLWNKVILDIHGTVPEEFEMAGDTTSRDTFSWLERTTIQKARYVITVTDEMSEHLKRKYSDLNFHTLCIPIAFFPNGYLVNKTISNDSKPRIIYAGGADPWQNTIKMLETAELMHEAFDFRFFTPSAKKWRAQPGYKKSFDVFAPSSFRGEEQLSRLLTESHLGFALRDDSIVNRVACPTKIVEYLAYGVLPIVLQPNIGDFLKYGYKYILLEELPQFRQKRTGLLEEDIKTNFLVSEKLKIQATKGFQTLMKLLNLDLTKVGCDLESLTSGWFFHSLRGICFDKVREIKTKVILRAEAQRK